MSLTKILSRGLGTGVGGKVLQVVQRSITGNETTTSTSFVATTVSVSITPTSASNKVLILLTSGFWSGGSDQLFLQLRRGSSTVVAPYTGSSGATTTANAMTMFNGSLSTRAKESWNYKHLDSPNTTNPVTYNIYGYFWTSDWSSLLYQYGAITNGSNDSPSTITLMEIGA